jgi:FMN phosphatase YigB (HAD superfamily)
MNRKLVPLQRDPKVRRDQGENEGTFFVETAVLLDFGDTLISEEVFIASGHTAMLGFLRQHYGWYEDPAYLRLCFQRIEANLWHRWGGRPPAVKEEAIRLAAIEYLINEVGSDPTRSAVEEALHWLIQGAGTSNCLQPGARESLEELAQVHRLAIVSNGLDAYTRLCLEQQDLMRLFAVYTISERVNVEKPDPAIIHLTLRQLGVAPERAVMVGNRADMDVRCANQAGCHAIWLRHPGAMPHPGADADFTVTSLRDLPAICQQLA